MAIFDGCPAEAPDGTTLSPSGDELPPPWTELTGRAQGDDGRTYSWSVVTRAALGDGGADVDTGAGGPHGRLVAVPDLGGAPLWLTEGDEALVVVDAPHFGPELLDVLQYGPAWLRARVFHPQLTEAEKAWLDSLERRDADELVPRVLAALEAAFGAPLRVEADQAVRAAEIMLEQGYVISTGHLFTSHRHRFSNRARTTITTWLADHAPD